MSAGNVASQVTDKTGRTLSKGRVALFGLLWLIGSSTTARANVCPDLDRLINLYAVYEIVSVEKYRGGLTSRAQAEAFIGREVELSVELFRMGKTTIRQPRYEIRCHAAPVEGEVTTDRWSSFYGYGTERRQIEVLDVFATSEAHPSYRFEVIGLRELWWLYDGWLYRLRTRVAN